MPKVTQVEPQKKNPHRFNIYLDGQFAFGADADLVVNHRLIVGKEILSENLETLVFEAEVGKLMDRIYGLLSVRLRSEKEIRDYLRQLSFKRKLKGHEELSVLAVEFLINRLKQRSLINDLEFAKSWVESRSKKKGTKVIQSELYKKGISRELLDQVLSVEGASSDQEKVAQGLLEKKIKIWKGLPNMEQRKKSLDFLMRRGFDYTLSRSVVDSLIKKGYDTEEENEEFDQEGDPSA